jgi:hypothetical protein
MVPHLHKNLEKPDADFSFYDPSGIFYKPFDDFCFYLVRVIVFSPILCDDSLSTELF